MKILKSSFLVIKSISYSWNESKENNLDNPYVETELERNQNPLIQLVNYVISTQIRYSILGI